MLWASLYLYDMSRAFKAQFGGKVTSELKERYAESPQWNGKVFKNLIETSMDMSPLQIPTLLKENFKQRKVKRPQRSLPMLPIDPTDFDTGKNEILYSWFGHSAVLLKVGGKNLLIDPMLGPDASPIAPFKTRRFTDDVLAVIQDLPPLDAILLTHDHYDHLDYASIQLLKGHTQKWITALGVGRHLKAWDIPADHIQEMDWWEELNLDELRMTFTPSRHFSGRGTTDRSKSLWGGFVFQYADKQVYWSGDGGYGPHFKTIGERFGSFDLGFMECGQYNKRWHAIHMFPEETVQAAIEAGVKRAVPVHWGSFSLALHSWWDPIDRFCKTAESEGLDYDVPQLGEVVSEKAKYPEWWKSFLPIAENA